MGKKSLKIKQSKVFWINRSSFLAKNEDGDDMVFAKMTGPTQFEILCVFPRPDVLIAFCEILQDGMKKLLDSENNPQEVEKMDPHLQEQLETILMGIESKESKD